MKTIFKSVVTAFIIGVSFTACHSSIDKVAQTKENAAETKIDLKQSSKDSLAQEQSDSLTLWQKFKEESEEEINGNKKRIVELKKDIAYGSEDVKTGYQKTINELERRNDNLRNSVADYKDDEKEKLEAFKQKVNNEINKIGKSLREIKIK